MHAPRCVGETRRVAGHVDHVHKLEKGHYYVNFCAKWRGCPFTAVVFAKSAGAFPPVATWAGRDVLVTGQITQYQGRVRIVLDDPSQVRFKDAGPMRPPPEPPPGAASEPPSEPRRRKPIPSTTPVAGEPVATRPMPESKPPDRDPALPEPITSRLDQEHDEDPRPARSGYFLPPDPKPDPKPAAKPVAKPAAKPTPPPAPRPSAPAVEGEVRAAVSEAARLMGRKVRLRGQVQRLDFHGNDLVAFFQVGGKEQRFVAVVTEVDLPKVSAEAEKWDTRTVEVSGEVAMYDGRPAIYVHAPTQVRAVDAKALRGK